MRETKQFRKFSSERRHFLRTIDVLSLQILNLDKNKFALAAVPTTNLQSSSFAGGAPRNL